MKPTTHNHAIIPANEQAERAVLGMIFLKNEWAYTFGSELSAFDFSLDSHRRIFAVQQSLAERGKPIDFITVEDELRARKELELVGGREYVESLPEGLFTRGIDPKHYADKITEKAKLRSLINIAHSAIEAAQNPTAVSNECIGELTSRLFEITARTERSNVLNSTESVSRLMSLLDHYASHEGITGLTTGIDMLDTITQGIQHGELWIVGARPGQGKTSLARQIAKANARKGIPVMFYSAEMQADMLRLCDLVGESGLTLPKIRSGFFSKEDYQRLTNTCQEMAEWSLFISEAGEMDIREMVAHAMMMIRQCGIQLIIADHLQIIADREHDDRKMQVSNIANKLRVLAKSTGVPVILLSQLARSKDGDQIPQLWQLKESGDVEAHAHTVIMPYVPLADNGELIGEEAQLYIRKQRYGETGSIPVAFRKARLDFVAREVLRRELPMHGDRYETEVRQ